MALRATSNSKAATASESPTSTRRSSTRQRGRTVNYAVDEDSDRDEVRKAGESNTRQDDDVVYEKDPRAVHGDTLIDPNFDCFPRMALFNFAKNLRKTHFDPIDESTLPKPEGESIVEEDDSQYALDSEDRVYSDAVTIQHAIHILTKLNNQLEEDFKVRKANLRGHKLPKINPKMRKVTVYGVLRALLEVCTTEPRAKDVKEKLLDSLQASHNVDKSLRGSRSAYNKSSIPVSNSNDPDSDENTTGQPLPSPLNDSSLSNLVWSSITDILNILKASDDEAYALTQSHVENLSRRILRGGNPDDWIEIKSLVESMEKASQFQGKSPKAPLVYIRGKLFDEEARTNHTYNKIIKSIDVLKEANPGQGDVMFQLDFLSETMLDKEDFHQGWSDKTSKLLNMTLISLETIFKQHRARLMSAKILREKLFNNRMLHSHWTEHDYVAMAGDLEAIGKANQTHSKTWLATTFAPTFANLERSFAELSMESPKASNARQSIPGERPLVPESISKIGQEIENRVGEVRRPQHRVPGPGLGAAPEISRKSPNSITIEFHPPDTFSLDWSKSQFQKILTNCGVTVSPAMIDTNSDTRSLITKLADTQEVKKMLITLYCNAVGMRELLHFLIKGNTWDPLSTFVKYGRDLTDESKNEFQRTLEGYGIEVSKVFEAKAESTLIAYIPNTWDIEKNMRALADVAADHNTKMEFCFEGKPLRSKVEIDQSSPENLTSSVPRSKKRLRDDVDTNIKGAQKTFLNQAADPPRSANRPSLSTARDSQQMTSSRGNMEHSSSNHSAPQGDLYAERREPRNNSRHMSRETYKQPRSASRSNNHGGDNWNRRSGSPRRGWGRMGDSRSNRRLSGSSRFDSNMRESTYGQHRRNSSSFCDDGNMREGEPDKRSRDAETTNYSDLFDEDRSARKGSNTRNQEYRRN